jgi:hypothetical protein
MASMEGQIMASMEGKIKASMEMEGDEAFFGKKETLAFNTLPFHLYCLKHVRGTAIGCDNFPR